MIEHMQAIFIETNLPKNLWPLVFDATLYIKNHTYSIAIFDYIVSIIYWTNTKPNLLHIYLIKSLVIYQIPDAKQMK